MKTISKNIAEDLNLTVQAAEPLTLFEFGDKNTKSASSSTEITLNPQARLTYIYSLFGGGKLNKKLTFNLHEESEINFIGIFLGDDHEEHNIKATVNHLGPHSLSNIEVKGILTQSAFNSFRGLIKIARQAPKSSAHLEQRVLLLSKTAVCEGQPELEILANDVKASHAADISKINEEQLFYMTSRGISPQLGKKMIIRGFLKSLIQKIDQTAIKDQLEKMFNDKICTLK